METTQVKNVEVLYTEWAAANPQASPMEGLKFLQSLNALKKQTGKGRIARPENPNSVAMREILLSSEDLWNLVHEQFEEIHKTEPKERCVRVKVNYANTPFHVDFINTTIKSGRGAKKGASRGNGASVVETPVVAAPVVAAPQKPQLSKRPRVS